MTDYSLSDLAAATRGADDLNGFGGGAWWIIVLFLFAFMGGGFGMRGNQQMPNGEPVTEAGLCSAMNFNDLQNAIGRLSDNENLHMMQLSQGLSSIGYENLRNFADTQASIKDGNYAMSAQLSNCCCETKQLIGDLKYNDAMNTAAINANTTAQTQKILDAIQQNKIETLQAQVSELKTQQMFCGIPRINPYGYGIVPQFATPCAGANI